MSHEVQDQLAGQSSHRARRIRDEEWEPHRPTIEKLYGEQGISRIDMIKRLKQDGFEVTEKQFKHILSKWKLKKKISSTDMGVILATKRKRNAEGKATQFTYYGHVVAEEKLQRSEKRRNVSTPSCSDMPSYIQAFSPRSSNRSPRLSQVIPTAGFDISNDDRISAFRSYENAPWSSPRQRSSLPTGHQTGFVLDPNDLPSGVTQHQNAEEPWRSLTVPTAPGGIMSLHNTADHPDPFTLTTNSNDFNEGFAQNLLSNNIDCMIDTTQCLLPPEDSRATLATPLSDSMTAIPLSTPIALREPVGGFDSGESPSTHSLRTGMTPNKVLFYGSNPENIISPLQMIRTKFQKFQDEKLQPSHLFIYGSQKLKLFNEIKGNTLLSGIEDAVLWAYEVSAGLIRQRRTTHHLGYLNALPLTGSMEHSAGLDQTSNQNETELNNIDCLRVKSAKISCYDDFLCYGKHDGWTLRIESWQSRKEAFDSGNDTPFDISIFAIPEVRNRSESAVHISFMRRPQNLPLYTIIKTYNVVPDNSEIIKCVRENDTRAFRKLIEERKASPRDVDSRGSSLLSYALHNGCSEIFRFLLDNGVNTDQCRTLHDESSCLIDCIWQDHFQLMSYGPLGPLDDIDQCKSMTEMALANGCIVEGSVSQFGIMPSPLFAISYRNTQHGTVRRYVDTMKQFLAIGYDKERRNMPGQTPLLFAASVTRLRSLTTLRLLLAEKSDMNAVDDQGRSALHLCLDFSACLFLCFGRLCTSPTSAVEEQFGNKGSQRAQLIGDNSEEDESCSDNADSDQESAISIARSESDDDTNTPRKRQGLRKCYWCDGALDKRSYEFAKDHSRTSQGCISSYCEARDTDDFAMPIDKSGDDKHPDFEPEPWMCRARQRLKLLALLQAGCDPNVLDNKGASPSDYAERERLWPQWEWALAQTGWRYDEVTGRCEREDALSEFCLEDFVRLSDEEVEAGDM